MKRMYSFLGDGVCKCTKEKKPTMSVKYFLTQKILASYAWHKALLNAVEQTKASGS